jgi:hypothetical protein
MSALDDKAVANGSQPGASQSAAPPDGQILTGKQEHCKWADIYAGMAVVPPGIKDY